MKKDNSGIEESCPYLNIIESLINEIEKMSRLNGDETTNELLAIIEDISDLIYKSRPINYIDKAREIHYALRDWGNKLYEQIN